MSSNRIPPAVSSKSSPSAIPRPAEGYASSLGRNLTRLVVEVAETIADVSGVRLWQTADGEPILWQEKGTLPVADGSLLGSDVASPGAAASRWTIPLTRNGQILGYLEVFGSNLSGAALATLGKLATLGAAALGQEEDQRTAQALSAILESTKLLNSTLNLPELLDIILQLSTRLCEADRGTIFLLDRRYNELWSLKGLGLERREIRLSINKGIAGWVAREGSCVRVEDAAADPRFDPDVDRDLGYRTRELIALAIRNDQGEIIGVLELLNKKSGPFCAADEQALAHLSVYVAVALEKAQLHHAILAKQRMESDLQLARNVQGGLLPEQPPQIDGMELGVAYTPSLIVGGDYYDFVRLKSDALLVVIGDVEGKGVASALMMASLQAFLRTSATHVHALEALITSVNEFLFSRTRVRKLLSLFVAVIDERNRALHYINAGHVPPVLIRKDGETMRLEEGGLVLGVFPNASYKRGRVQLRQGDIFAAYTDGVTEAMDLHGEQYGLGRLVNLVHMRQTDPAGEIVKTALSEVDRFSQQDPNQDDRVVLVLKVN